MTVTKQQQLKRISRIIPKWNDAYKYAELMTNPSINMTGYRFTDYPSGDYAFITRGEWQQERDKMSSKPEVDNSWHERGEFPFVGCECEVFVNDENKWMHFEVIAIRDGHVLGWCRESSCGFQSNKKYEFRPLRTEREKAIDEMSLLAIGCEKYAITQNAAKAVCELLYDAGFRKVNS